MGVPNSAPETFETFFTFLRLNRLNPSTNRESAFLPADLEHLLEPRVDRAVGLRPETVARLRGVALVHEPVAVQVLDAPRVEGESATPGEEGRQLEAERQVHEAARRERVGHRLVRGAEVLLGVVVVAEGRAHAAGEQVVLVVGVGVRQHEGVAVAVALVQGHRDAVVLDAPLVGDLVDALAPVSGLAEVRVSRLRREEVDDAPGQEVAAAAVHVGHGHAEIAEQLLVDAEAEGVGHRREVVRVA